MHVSNIKLSKTLYGLTGWKDTNYKWRKEMYKGGYVLNHSPTGYDNVPAYDISYLLRKLPPNLMMSFNDPDEGDSPRVLQGNIFVSLRHDGQGAAGYGSAGAQFYLNYGDNPEDALCNLAIMLIEKGILEL